MKHRQLIVEAMFFFFSHKKHQNKTKIEWSWHFSTLIQCICECVCVVHMQIKLVLAPVSLFFPVSRAILIFLAHWTLSLHFIPIQCGQTSIGSGKLFIHIFIAAITVAVIDVDYRRRLLLYTHSRYGDCSIDYWLLWIETPRHSSVWPYVPVHCLYHVNIRA